RWSPSKERSNRKLQIFSAIYERGGGIAKPPRRSDSEDLFRRLPDEIVLDILSRLGTVNETARCGSLGKRWRGICRLIDGGVLDFDKSLDLLRSTIPKTPTLEISKEAQLRFANAVNQALSWHRSETLDALRIAFDLYGLGEEAWKWIEFGLKKRVKELRLLSCFSYSGDHRIPLPLLTPEFLGTQDLSRLEVLELEGLSIITQETVDYIFSHCHSLKRWVLRNSCFRGEVVRVSNVEKLQYLEFTRLYFARRIELMSAPNLHTVKFTGNATICFGDQLPQLLEASFCGALKASDYSLPWPPSQFCSIPDYLKKAWEPSDLSAGSTWWEHHSLEVLKLYGVHRTSKLDEPRFRRPGRESHDARVLCLEVAAHIIINSPSLNEVLIDTRHQNLMFTSTECRPSCQIDIDTREARMELETQLQGRSASPHIHYTYR
ncbi:unnamed protein product, partial [Linum tenue]